MTFVRPSPRPAGAITAPGLGTTQVLTSDVLRPVMHAAARPRPSASVRVAPASPDLLPAAAVADVSAAEPEPAVVQGTWTLERKLLAANLVLGLLVLVEFIAF